MTDEQLKAELSPEYLEWSERDGDCGIMIPVEEIQRLAEVIVGLRAENLKWQSEHAVLKMDYHNADAELSELRQRCADMEIRENAGSGIIIEQTAEIDRQARELEQLRADLSTARQISRDMIAAVDRARGTGVAQDEAQTERKPQVGDEVWYCPFRNMRERENGRMVKILKLGPYEFRIDDGRRDSSGTVWPPLSDDERGTWLRNDSYGITWWWSDLAAAQPSGEGTER